MARAGGLRAFLNLGSRGAGRLRAATGSSAAPSRGAGRRNAGSYDGAVVTRRETKKPIGKVSASSDRVVARLDISRWGPRRFSLECCPPSLASPTSRLMAVLPAENTSNTDVNSTCATACKFIAGGNSLPDQIGPYSLSLKKRHPISRTLPHPGLSCVRVKQPAGKRPAGSRAANACDPVVLPAAGRQGVWRSLKLRP
jgi:hypothetical protein